MIHDHLLRIDKRLGAQTFLLIGANDGVIDDHLCGFIRRRKWTGAAVEPLLQYFHELEKQFRSSGVSCINIAIHSTETSMKFWYLADDPKHPLPPYSKGVGSFNPQHVAAIASEVGNNPDIKSINVPCMTVSDVLQRSGMDNVNVIIIDAEGYDAEIVNSLNLTPKTLHTIVFEHKHLPPKDLDAVVTLLNGEGVLIECDKFDVLAIREKSAGGPG